MDSRRKRQPGSFTKRSFKSCSVSRNLVVELPWLSSKQKGPSIFAPWYRPLKFVYLMGNLDCRVKDQRGLLSGVRGHFPAAKPKSQSKTSPTLASPCLSSSQGCREPKRKKALMLLRPVHITAFSKGGETLACGSLFEGPHMVATPSGPVIWENSSRPLCGRPLPPGGW